MRTLPSMTCDNLNCAIVREIAFTVTGNAGKTWQSKKNEQDEGRSKKTGTFGKYF
jgi:hypothetical protein